jgi:hypothetical protein
VGRHDITEHCCAVFLQRVISSILFLGLFQFFSDQPSQLSEFIGLVFGERVDQRASDCPCSKAQDSSYYVARSLKQEILATESRPIVEHLLYLLSAHEALLDQAIGYRDRGYIDDIVPTRDNLVQFPRGRRTIEFPGCIYHTLLKVPE